MHIEAWAPTREACLAEAVTGLVGSFADTAGADPGWTVTADLAAPTDEEALVVVVLDEVIYRLEHRWDVTVWSRRVHTNEVEDDVLNGCCSSSTL